MPFPQAVPKYPGDRRAPTAPTSRRAPARPARSSARPSAIDFDQQDEEVTVEVGNIVLATGFELFDARRVEQYGYGRLPNVFTSLEFERMSNAAGPTNGQIVLRDGVTEPKAVGIVHCVGSRDRNYNNYCSAICCMQSLKFAHLVREHTDAEVYKFYIDIRTPGKAFDEFYQRVLEEGTRLRPRPGGRGDRRRSACPTRPTGGPADRPGRGHPGRHAAPHPGRHGRPVGRPRAAARTPRRSARRFGISCSSDGWVIERHPKLDPVATMTEGIFAAGCALGPQDIPASVANGRGRRGAHPGPDPAGRDVARAGPRHGRRDTLLGLPDLQRPVPVQRDRLRRGPRRERGEPGPVPGLRHVRRRLPGGRDHRHRLLATPRSWPRSTACSSSVAPTGEATRGPCRPRGGAGMSAPTPATAPSRHGALRARHPRLHLQLVQLPGRGPGRDRPDQVPAQRPPRPADVLRPPRPDLRPAAFARGADAVMVSGCWPGECHYRSRTSRRSAASSCCAACSRGLGIEPARLQLVWASAAEGSAARRRDRADHRGGPGARAARLGPAGRRAPAAEALEARPSTSEAAELASSQEVTA